MYRRDPIFTKRTKSFTIHIPLMPLMSYRQNIFFTVFAAFIVAISGGIYMYRIISSPNPNLLQIIISIPVILFIMLAPFYALMMQNPKRDSVD